MMFQIDHPGRARVLTALLAPLADLMADPEVTEIMVDGPGRVSIEKKGSRRPTDVRFDSIEHLMAIVRALAGFAGVKLDPFGDSKTLRFPDNSRVHVVYGPTTPLGVVLSIRRQPTTWYSLEDLVGLGSMSPRAARYLMSMVLQRRNIAVSGSTGDGKSSLLAALMEKIPADLRIVLLETDRELNIQHPGALTFEEREPDHLGRGGLSLEQLLIASLRLNPDILGLAEIRGKEANVLREALRTGHDGGIFSLHATTPLDAFSRFESLVAEGMHKPDFAVLRRQLAQSVHCIIQLRKDSRRRRQVSEIVEIRGVDPAGEPRIRPIFDRRRSDELTWTGRSSMLADLIDTDEVEVDSPWAAQKNKEGMS